MLRILIIRLFLSPEEHNSLVSQYRAGCLYIKERRPYAVLLRCCIPLLYTFCVQHFQLDWWHPFYYNYYDYYAIAIVYARKLNFYRSFHTHLPHHCHDRCNVLAHFERSFSNSNNKIYHQCLIQNQEKELLWFAYSTGRFLSYWEWDVYFLPINLISIHVMNDIAWLYLDFNVVYTPWWKIVLLLTSSYYRAPWNLQLAMTRFTICICRLLWNEIASYVSLIKYLI